MITSSTGRIKRSQVAKWIMQLNSSRLKTRTRSAISLTLAGCQQATKRDDAMYINLNFYSVDDAHGALTCMCLVLLTEVKTSA
jgi:hypothetical protein